MRAFVEIRHIVFKQNDLKEQFRGVRERLSEHDVQLNHIYDAMENLLDAISLVDRSYLYSCALPSSYCSFWA